MTEPGPGVGAGPLFRIRASAVVVREGALLLVRQRVSAAREWSLPGGLVETGESIAAACVRELYEETGLRAEVGELLYVGERLERSPPLLHVSFRMSLVGTSEPRPPRCNDTNPILAAAFVPIGTLKEHGFPDTFCALAEAGFPTLGAMGRYAGPVSRLGL